MALLCFSTMEIKYNQDRFLLRGYQSYEMLVEAIAEISGYMLLPQTVEATPEALQKFLEKHPKMTLEEVRQAFDLATLEEAEKLVDGAVALGGVRKGEYRVTKTIEKVPAPLQEAPPVCGIDGMCE